MSIYYMFNKPAGCVSARTDERHRVVMDYFPENMRSVLFPVGRLDKDTEGLFLLTDDGALNYRLLSPESHIPKTYFFYALGSLEEDVREQIERGIRLYPTRELISAPSSVRVEGRLTLADIREHLCPRDLKRANRRPDTPVIYGRVTVTEGKKHQVKRMLMYAGCRIAYLKRISMGELELDPSLAPGEYRPLRPDELELLRK